jgi:hypothetical protein
VSKRPQIFRRWLFQSQLVAQRDRACGSDLTIDVHWFLEYSAVTCKNDTAIATNDLHGLLMLLEAGDVTQAKRSERAFVLTGEIALREAPNKITTYIDQHPIHSSKCYATAVVSEQSAGAIRLLTKRSRRSLSGLS